jgi:hypothetical protein
MARPRASSDDRGMFPDAYIPLGQVPATANRLQRAAGELRLRAGSPFAVPSLPVTLAHLEETFEDLAASMRHMAEAAAEWSGAEDAKTDEAALSPEARALLWHLRSVADTLMESRDGCAAARDWTRRLLDDAASEARDPCMAPEDDGAGRPIGRVRREATRMAGRIR